MRGCCKPLFLLVCAAILSSHAVAGQLIGTSRATATGVVDVALSKSGALTGRFLDTDGHGIDGAEVWLMRERRILAKSKTGHEGAYRFPAVRPGVYQVVVEGRHQMVRVWEPASRPPVTLRLLTIVRHEPVVRGQIDGSYVAEAGLIIGIGGAITAGFAIVEAQDARKEAEAMRDFFKQPGPASP